MPWSCPGCRKETCESCFGAFGHCKICSDGRSEPELVTRANATGEFDFEFDEILAGASGVPVSGDAGDTGAANPGEAVAVQSEPNLPGPAHGQSLEDFCDAYQKANW